jgi:uncharacterized protein (DUF4415 family)
MGRELVDLDDLDADPASRPDEDSPECTAEEMRNARPALEVITREWGPEVAEFLRRGRGRPAKPDRKINQTLRLDPDVLEYFKRQGPGWQARMNAALRSFMDRK